MQIKFMYLTLMGVWINMNLGARNDFVFHCSEKEISFSDLMERFLKC